MAQICVDFLAGLLWVLIACVLLALLRQVFGIYHWIDFNTAVVFGAVGYAAGRNTLRRRLIREARRRRNE